MGLLPYGTLADEAFAHSFFMQLNSLQSESEAKDWMKENEAKNAVGFASIGEDNLFSFAEYERDEDIPEGSVFIMALNGPVMPESSWGVPGLDVLGQQLDWAIANENISSIVFRLETGGGSAYKLWPFCDKLLEAREKKPIVNLVTGIGASAGVAIFTHGTETYADHASTRVGSIGAAMSHLDIIPWFEKEGCKYHYVNAPQNPDKNKEMVEMREDKYDAIKENLGELASEFHSKTKNLRKDISSDALTGKMFNAERGTELGIIDGLATLEMAVSRAYSLANQKPTI